MVMLFLAIAFILAGFFWIKTGRSTFWHLAMFFLLLEAIRLQVIDDIAPACRIFVQHVRERFAMVRAEFGEVA